MNTRDNMIRNYDDILDARYGKEGTAERIKFEEDAYAYYTGLILRDARKEAKVSQLTCYSHIQYPLLFPHSFLKRQSSYHPKRRCIL